MNKFEMKKKTQDEKEPQKRYTKQFDLIGFDTSDISFNAENNDVRQWIWADQDLLTLFYHPIPPDINTPIGNIDRIRQFYRKIAADNSVAYGKIDIITVDNCPAILTIAKRPQDPSGMMYIGSITIPFRDFSYVVNITCPEHGTTGIRDAVVAAQYMESGGIRTKEDGGTDWGGWMQDPYEPTFQGQLMWNKSEDEQHDEHFPDHPLSRLRRKLPLLEKSIALADSVKQSAPFTGPLDK